MAHKLSTDKNMKILIVEDNDDLREVIARSLEKERYVAETAANYSEARMKAFVYEYDCILLDIMLPDGNGLDLLRELHKAGRRVNVIILSAKDSIDDKVNGLELGADDYLPKPFHLAELHARIKSVLSGRDVSGLTKEEKLNVTLTPFEEDIAKRRLKLAAVLQYTLPGNPMIYYGDERGMEGYEDPTNRKTVDWKHRDEDIFALYKKLGRIRKKYASVFRGTTYLETGNGMAVFHRMARSRELTVLVNSGNTVLTYYIDGKYVDLLTDREYDFGDISIAPMGAMILAKKN